MLRSKVIPIAALFVGCGATSLAEPARPAEAVPAERSPPAPAADVEVATAPPGPEAPIERVRFAIPEDGALPELTRLPVRLAQSRGVAWDEVALPDPLARRRLSMLIEDLAYEHGSIPADGAGEHAGCRAVLATSRVVSFRCRPNVLGRDGGDHWTDDYVEAHFAIDGSEVRPFEGAQALAPGATPDALIDMRGCIDRLAPLLREWEPARRRGAARQSCRALGSAHVMLGPEGLVLILDRHNAIGVTTRAPSACRAMHRERTRAI